MDTLNAKLYKLLNKEFIIEFKKQVKNECNPCRTPKYSIEYYLYYIILVLTDLNTWKALTLLHDTKPKNHYKTIQDKHYEWSGKNLYEKTYKNIHKIYHLNTTNDDILTLFIDSSNIYNKSGIENVGYGQNPKKQESRISAICDKNKNIYSFIMVKTINKTEKKKTLPHDSITIVPNLTNLFETDFKYKSINLVGDKGYAITQQTKENIKNKYKVDVVYPHKKNQKQKTSEEHKILLKDRYVIENVFAKLKVYNRLTVRKDKKECSYMGFLYLASMLIFKN
jgi:hypothetical protein